MKVILIPMTMPALLLMAGAPAGNPGVLGSKHDFTGPPGRFGDACAACHVPHVQAVRAAPGTTTQPALGLYRVPRQRRVYQPGRFDPGPGSLVCLSCHDGTVATSTIGAAHAVRAGARQGYRLPDGYAWRDHPVGVPYPQDPRKFRPRAIVEAEGIVSLPDGRVECISCHDPHNQSGVEKLLVSSNRRSRLCLSCHQK